MVSASIGAFGVKWRAHGAGASASPMAATTPAAPVGSSHPR